jgi:gluconate 2-dehydrogenase gamma chain
MSDGPETNSRRSFLKSTLITISSVTLTREIPSALASPDPEQKHSFFNDSEWRFLESAVDRLIPPDERWPGAADAGVVNYIDLQMAGAWGRGELLCMIGPHYPGEWTQGYQLEYTPAELFRRSISAINRQFTAQGKSFDQLPGEEKDTYLTSLEKGGIDLDGVPSEIFFDQLLDQTVQGFFSDPIYGGNKNKRGWRMIGFPGAYADYYDLVDKHGIEFHREPLGIGEGTSTDSMMRKQATAARSHSAQEEK